MGSKENREDNKIFACLNCGAIAADIDSLCNPDEFGPIDGCHVSEKIFADTPEYGQCRPKHYVCLRCGREALSEDYLCDSKVL